MRERRRRVHRGARAILQLDAVPVGVPPLVSSVHSLEDITSISRLRIPGNLELQARRHMGGKARMLLGAVLGDRPFHKEIVRNIGSLGRGGGQSAKQTLHGDG